MTRPEVVLLSAISIGGTQVQSLKGVKVFVDIRYRAMRSSLRICGEQRFEVSNNACRVIVDR